MAAIINALDNINHTNHTNHTNNTQYGENGHAEYGWSKNIQEQILQFSFQLTRIIHPNIVDRNILEEKLDHLLNELMQHYTYGNSFEKEISKGHLSILYKMIGHTRDIIDGKGEYTLSYMMVCCWNKINPSLAQFALRSFVLHEHEHENTHPYGSWKDLKYFCKYCKEVYYTKNNQNTTKFEEHNLVQYAVQLMNEQIKTDYHIFLNFNNNEHNNTISLAAKWVPREKSSFGWLYNMLCTQYFPEYLSTAHTSEQIRKATNKCKTEYRKVLSTLNKYLDTVQIKQCHHQWSMIDFNNVTSISLIKQKKAFLNVKKNGMERYPESCDRTICAENFGHFIHQTISNNKEIKGMRIGMADFVKQAISSSYASSDIEKEMLNSQWRDNAKQNGALGKMIAMVDVSGSMDGDPLHVAIALGIRIAEKSILGKRILTFSSNPTWVNLDDCPDFITSVMKIRSAEWGMNTNFYAALDMILQAIIQNKMKPEDVQDMVLVILSDMQMDAATRETSYSKQTLYEKIQAKYKEAGLSVCGKPYKPPHILFWNLRSTNGFPCLSNQPNASMMSGFNPSLLNVFCDEGINGLQSCTPWSLLMKSLENQRYEPLLNKINEIMK